MPASPTDAIAPQESCAYQPAHDQMEFELTERVLGTGSYRLVSTPISSAFDFYHLAHCTLSQVVLAKNSRTKELFAAKVVGKYH